MISTDSQLLRKYFQDGSETAFTELVERHINLVYGAAMRQAGGDVTLAEDVTQAVFTALASKAAQLSRHPTLGGWLYNYVRYATANERRANRRRQRREQASIKMSQENPSSEEDRLWEEIRPVLDDVMHDLNEKDRTAVTLRFHEKQSLRQVGEALGLTENAARMRVGRALDKLRNLLIQRGVTSTNSTLAAALGVGATFCAPPGMAATIATKALTANACVGAATTTTAISTIMKTTHLKITLAAAFITAGVGLPVWQESRIETLRQEKGSLQTELDELPDLRAEVERLKAAAATKPDPALELENENLAAKREIAGLRGRLNVALSQLARQKAEAPTAEDLAATSPAIQKVMDASMRMAAHTQTLAKLPRLTEKLSLSKSQEEDVRDILQRQHDQIIGLSEKMLTGEVKLGEMPKKAEDFVNPMAEIQALLTPEQKEAYQDYQREEHSANARLAANGELLQIQDSLGLTQEQQDKAFQALYEHTFDVMTGQKSTPAKPPSANSDFALDYASSMQWSLDQKAKALEGVLTPEQLEKYRQLQAEQLKMMSGMVSSVMPAE